MRRPSWSLTLSLFLLLSLLLAPLKTLALSGLSIEAESLDFHLHEGRIEGVGEALFLIDEYTIRAHTMEVFLEEGLLKASGDVRIEGPETLEGEELTFSLIHLEGVLKRGRLKEKEFRLEALQFDFSSDRILLYDGYYSPCPPNYQDIYLKADRFELTEDMRLIGHQVHVYLFHQEIMVLPKYSGWIRYGRFYPSSPVPTPGYSTERGFYLDLSYTHYIDRLTQGEYLLRLAEDPYLKVDYSQDPNWDAGLRFREGRQGLSFHYHGIESLNLDIALQRGENFFLAREKEHPITFWPYLSLDLERLRLKEPFYLTSGLSYAKLAENEEETIGRRRGYFQLKGDPYSLGNLSWRGHLLGQYTNYETKEELLEYGLENSLSLKLHPLFRVGFKSRLTGYEGTTPFLLDHPLPKEEMQGLRSYWDLSLRGEALGIDWELGGGLVKYPTGHDFGYGGMKLGIEYSPLEDLTLQGDYIYQRLKGEPLLEEDERRERNHLRPSITYSIYPEILPSLKLGLHGDWSFLEEDWEEILVALALSYGTSTSIFQCHLDVAYDIVERNWGEEGISLEMVYRTSKEMPYYQFTLHPSYTPGKDQRLLHFSIQRESPCTQVLLKTELVERRVELSFGTYF